MPSVSYWGALEDTSGLETDEAANDSRHCDPNQISELDSVGFNIIGYEEDPTVHQED